MRRIMRIFSHPAYRKENLEIKTKKELKEAKKLAGVSSEKEFLKRVKEYAKKTKDKFLLKLVTEKERPTIIKKEWEILLVPPFVKRFTISPNGKRFAYVYLEEKEFVVVDGKKEKGYEAILGMIFSPNGKHFGYVAKERKKFLVVIDGRETPKYDLINSFCLSPDGKHWAFSAERNRKKYIVLDGRENEVGYEETKHLIFSPSGKLAYVGEKENREVLVLNGREIKPHTYDRIYSLTFSPDGRISLLTEENKKLMVILGRKKLEEKENKYSEVGRLTVSNKGDFAYEAVEELHGSYKFIVWNGKEKRWPGWCFWPTLSPDGKHIAWITVLNGRIYLVFNEIVKEEVEDILFCGFFKKYFAYATREKRRIFWKILPL